MFSSLSHHDSELKHLDGLNILRWVNAGDGRTFQSYAKEQIHACLLIISSGQIEHLKTGSRKLKTSILYSQISYTQMRNVQLLCAYITKELCQREDFYLCNIHICIISSGWLEHLEMGQRWRARLEGRSNLDQNKTQVKPWIKISTLSVGKTVLFYEAGTQIHYVHKQIQDLGVLIQRDFLKTRFSLCNVIWAQCRDWYRLKVV